MENKDIFAHLSGVLLPWYEKNKRDLPWRKDNDPYHIWVSEIMLQQTRAEAVKGYYHRFLEALPTIEDLAIAEDEQLHKLWEGLGYYSRVRNLKKAAQRIVDQYNSRFPTDYDQVLALPGIGAYTAGAICSIAFNNPTPAVDGNVLRVVARLTNDNTPINLPAYKKDVHNALAAVYPDDTGAFTQALMELGATVCGPNRKPDCGSCPCNSFCQAFHNGTAEKLPIKTPKAERRIEDRTVFILSCDGAYALAKRPPKGLLAGLWQFPNVLGKLEMADCVQQIEKMGLQVREILRQVDRKHIFTHIQWNMRGIYVDVNEPGGDYVWMTQEQIDAEVALPTAFRQFWEVI